MSTNKRPMSIEDLLRFKFVGDVQVSPDNRRAAYVYTEVDGEKDGYQSSIFITHFSDEGRQFTYTQNSEKCIKDTKPRWSPCGEKLAFLSNRDGKNQVWLLPVHGGEAQPITQVAYGVDDFTWSPDGKKLALTVRGQINSGGEAVDHKQGAPVTPGSLDASTSTGEHEKTKQEKGETQTGIQVEDVLRDSDVKQITRLRYKGDGAGIYDDRRRQIYVLDLQTDSYVKVSDERFDFHGPAFSPAGDQLFYIGSKAEDQEWAYIPSIWQYDLQTQKESVLYAGKGAISTLSCSPDGKWLAFAGHDRGAISSGNTNVWVISTETQEAKNVSGDLDHPVGNLVGVDAKYDPAESGLIWNEQSTAVYFMATVGGDVQLFQTTVQGEVSSALTEQGHTITSFDMVSDEKVIMVQAHPHSTGDIVVQPLSDPKQKKILTTFNESLFSEVFLSEPEQIRYQGADGWDIEGWLLRPYGYEEGQKYPLILQIHGGPHTSYGNGFHHEFQVMASRGYAVLYTNPRGSHGYGEEFVQACLGDWAGGDYEDLMAGVDYVLDQYDFIDENQLFVTGGSYGGFMTNMIVTKTDRFKAAVTQRCISNMYSFYGTSDIGFYFGEWQLGQADLWEDEEKIMQFSPIRYARNVQTPTLILHSEQDLRCPMEQAEQWYVALRRLGVETKFVRFPDEDHNLSRNGKPKHRLERLYHLLSWFDERKS